MDTDTTSQNIDLQPDEHIWLEHFLHFVSVCNIVVGLMTLIIFLISHAISSGLVAFLIFCCSMVLVWARSQVRQGRVEYAGVILHITILTITILIAFIVPQALPALVCAPLVAVAISLPYLRATLSRWLLGASWSVSVLVVILTEYLQVQIFAPAPWLSGLPLTIGIAYAVGMIMLLLWRYHRRLYWLLNETRAANSALRAIQTELETAVVARTAALQERETRFRQVSELISDCAFSFKVVTDNRLITEWATESFTRIIGFTPAELDNLGGLCAIVDPDDQEIAQQGCQAVLGNQTDVSEFRIITSSGAVRWLRSYARPEWSNEEQRVIRIVGAIQDITERKQYEQQIEHLAYYDALTGLANRRLWLSHIAQTLVEAERLGEAFTVLYLDLDRFKAINDTLGHDIGDELLIQVATRLQSCVRTTDLLARLGGDEFAVLLPHTDEDEAIRIVQRITAHLDVALNVHEYTLRICSSIGIACYPRDGRRVGELLKHADIAMYRAKTSGSSYQVYHPLLQTYHQEQREIESELRQAIEQRSLTLHYQPIIDLHTGKIVRVEALVRWPHPTRGFITPHTFLPIAAESSLSQPLDRWVIRSALKQTAKWAANNQPITVAINLSANSLQDEDLVAYIRTYLAKTGIQPQQVMIEITEGAAMYELETTIRRLHELKSIGIHIALDDFGRGYASLTYLKQLPVDVVKLDRFFVRSIGHNPKDEGFLQSLISLGKSLGITVIVEGVETLDQLHWLQMFEGIEAQGYFIGFPEPPDMLTLSQSIILPLMQPDPVSAS